MTASLPPLDRYLESTPAPLISAIVPSYNKAKYLVESVESILAQDYQPVEVIIVNDGSPDDTTAVAQGLIAQYPNRGIRLIEKKNGGVSDARNEGLRNAQGRLVFCLDGDDKIDPRYLSTAVSSLRAQRANLFCSNQQNFGLREDQWIPHRYDPFALRYDNCIPSPAVWDRLLFEQTGGYNVALTYCEDWAFWIACSARELRVVQEQSCLTLYRVNDDGIAHESIANRWDDCFAVVAMANESLYPVDEILQSHQKYPRSAAQSLAWASRLKQAHPQNWLLDLFLGLQAEHAGRFDEAVAHMVDSVNNSHAREWQPMYRLAIILLKSAVADHHTQALSLLHEVRVLKPEMARHVRPYFEQGAK